MKWEINQPEETNEIDQLQEVLGVDKHIANLLVSRGITDFESAKSFFRPSLDELHDPYLMNGMEKAIDRIEEAFGNGEKIIIYGDYDVDGTTSVALVYSFFSEFYDNIDFYIPDRYKEGYGISLAGIDYAAEQGVSLVIALDCGIRAVPQMQYAKEKGVDFIICDHHLPGNELPEVIAVLDPKVEGCNYPYKELPGCGIGFKLSQAFAMRHEEHQEKLMSLLDLVAISIACDIVPITGENRILAHYGLLQLNTHKRPGLEAMLALIEFKRPLSISDLVFVVGPRINAAGRIHHGRSAVEMLTEKSADKAIQLCQEINQFNDERRSLDQNITIEALSLIGADEKLIGAKSTVVYQEHWHKGVIGIVASRLIETYYRPTVVLAESEGVVTGSARSVKGFDVHAAIEACSHLLDRFGGHKYAAGLSLKPENVEAFQEMFEDVVSKTITDEQLEPKLHVDIEIDFVDITPKFFRLLKQFAPFGPGNMRPVFVTKNVLDSGKSKTVGAEGAHLKIDVFQRGNTNLTMNGIAFNYGNCYGDLAAGKPFDIVYTLEENEWNGNVTVQMKVKDLRPSEES